MKKNLTKVIFLILVLALTIVPVLVVSSFAEGETVTLDVPLGVDTPSMNADGTLPEADAPSDDYTFVGWTESPMNVEKNTAPADLIEAGVAYSGTATKLYALYSRTEEGTAGESITTYTLVKDASELEVGDVIVIAASGYDYALSTTQNNNNRGQADITKSDETVTFEDDAGVQLITLEAGTTDDTLAFNVGSGYLYAASSSSNHLKTETTLSANSSWKIEIATDGVATIKAQGTNTRNWLRYNNTNNLFAAYASGQKDIVIYKKTTGTSTGESTAYYSTMTAYNATFYVNGVVDESISGKGLTNFPKGPEPTGEYAQNYVFAGWATEAAENSTSKPEMFTAGAELSLTGDTNFYAVYTYIATSDTPNYVSVDLTSVTDEDIVIITIVKDNIMYALPNTTSTSSGPAPVEMTGNIVNESTATENVLWKVTKSGDGYVFTSCADDTSNLYNTNANNGVRVGTSTSNNVYKVQNGYLYNVGTSRYLGVYNTQDWRSYTSYTTANIANQTLGIYSKVAEVSYYTSTLLKEDVTKFDSASVTLGDSLAMNYYVVAKSGTTLDGYYVNVTFNGETTTVDSSVLINGKYIFTFSGITPDQMGMAIDAVLYDADDNEVDSEIGYSVKQNLEDVKALYPDDEKLVDLIDATLVYGATAQKYRDNDVAAEDLVTAIPEDLTAVSTPTSKRDVINGDSAAENFRFTSVGVNFDYCNRVYAKFVTPDGLDNISVKLTISSTPYDDVEVQSISGGYIVYTPALKATEFNNQVKFDLYSGDTLVQTVTYSVNSYVFAKMNDSDANLKNLVIALYNYGVAAKAYNN